MSCELSVIIPVFNERANLELLADSLSHVLKASGEEYEILFIDDGSSDGSGAYLDSLAASDSRIREPGLRYAISTEVPGSSLNPKSVPSLPA